MNAVLISLILLCFTFASHAQYSVQTNPAGVSGAHNIYRTEIPLAQPTVVGSTYLNDEWQYSQIVLKNGSIIPDCPVRIELENANAEVILKGEVKFINRNFVSYIKVPNDVGGDSSIVKLLHQYTLDGVPLSGVINLIHNGKKYAVLKHYYFEFLAANYNVAMDVGSKNHRKIRKEKLFLAKGNDLFEVKGSTKKFTEKLGDDENKAQEILKANKLKLSDAEDLTVFVKLLEN